MTLSKSQIKILDAAKLIYVQKGYHGTSMNAIAEAVGIRKASLYAHFNHKEALFTILIEEILESHIHEVNQLLMTLDSDMVKKSMYRLIKSYIKYCYETPDVEVWTSFYYFPPESMKEWILNKTHQVEKVIKQKMIDLFIEGQRQGVVRRFSPEHLVATFYHFMLGYVLSSSEYQYEEIRDELLFGFQLLWQGIANNERNE